MINNKPNIFEYATKELSQDAVFMYLLDCYNSGNAVDFEIGEDFLNLIYTTQNSKIVKPVKRIVIKKQYHNIDVLVLVDYIDSTTDVIIIEDKTYSSEHDNQLKRYYEDIVSDGIENKKINNVYGVYFKLGELAYGESEALKINENFEYRTMTSKSFLNFLKEHKKSNILLELIYEYYYERLEYIHIIDETKDYSNPDNLNFETVLANSYSQYMYLRWIMNKTIGSDDYFEGNQYGVMNYGKPCTQYRFVFTEDDLYNGWKLRQKDKERMSKYSYFFRIDHNTKGWYISINQYDENGDKKWKEKSEIRDKIREEVYKIIEQNGMRHNTNNYGKKESKICLFNINSFDEVNRLLPVLQAVYEKVLDLAVMN